MISFVSKDNEGNQNLLAKDRQAGQEKFSIHHKPNVGASKPAPTLGICCG
jgi:hypothetical protein